MALGAGSLPEWFGICLRSDCSTVKMLRLRALRCFLKRGAASAAPSAAVAAADLAIRRIGYASAEDVSGAVVKEYAELLRLDIALSEDAASLFGGQPGWTLEELVYKSDDPWWSPSTKQWRRSTWGTSTAAFIGLEPSTLRHMPPWRCSAEGG